MPFVINCPKCPTPMQVPDGSVGKQVTCPRCGYTFIIGAPQRQPVVAGMGSSPAVPAPPPPPARPPSGAAILMPPSNPGVAAPPSAASIPTPASGSRPVSSASTPGFSLPSMPAVGGAAPATCPACGSALNPGAISCMDCGYLIQTEASAAGEDAGVIICPNPACGVANPPSEKVCARCNTPLPLPPGTLIQNRYKIEKLLAMGGFGAVYRAIDTRGGNRQVAVKEMLCTDPQEFAIRLNFFRREAEILKNLASVPIVPHFYDLIEQGQQAYLVMEFIPGRDLLKIMEASNNQPFPMDLVIEWGKNICDVLSTMHNLQPPVVHRDLKPENVMLLEDGRTIKMIDFGTARDLGRNQRERNSTKTRVYTEGYAPPEQIIGKPEPRSDLFALAGTLYQLATGKAPEGYYTSKELETQLVDPACPYPPQHRWFFELVKINLAEDVNDRYFSAREFKTDLERRQVTAEIGCPKCKYANKVREPYCTKCGEGLTEPAALCHACGKNNRMGSRHCIYCGNRIR